MQRVGLEMAFWHKVNMGTSSRQRSQDELSGQSGEHILVQERGDKLNQRRAVVSVDWQTQIQQAGRFR
jgi:hypothetical protein